MSADGERMGKYLGMVGVPPLVPVVLPGRGTSGEPVWCKLEFLNPSGSTKDRIARYILEKAWRRGDLRPGGVVVEASSGSTSIALALVCAQMGLGFVAFIPDTATSERELMVRAYGGEVRRIAGGMGEVMAAAECYGEETGAFAARQFANPDNAEAHRSWTAQEVLAQLGGRGVDAVVSGVGTGGTLRGLCGGFREAGCRAVPYAAIPCCGGAFSANPECCSLEFSGKVPGVIDGMSVLYADWKGSVEAEGLVEVAVDDGLCLELTRELWACGFPVGPSSGLNFAAALEAQEKLGSGAVVVTVFPDRMERYFSHAVFGELAGV